MYNILSNRIWWFVLRVCQGVCVCLSVFGCVCECMDDTRVKETNKNRICKENRLNMVGWLAGRFVLGARYEQRQSAVTAMAAYTQLYMCHFNYSNFFIRSLVRWFVCSRLVHRQRLFATNAMWFRSHNDKINVPSITIATRLNPRTLRFKTKIFCAFSCFEWTKLCYNACVCVVRKFSISFYVNISMIFEFVQLL